MNKVLPIIIGFTCVFFVALAVIIIYGMYQTGPTYAQTATNLTKLFTTNKTFANCYTNATGSGCSYNLNVLYEGPNLLVLQQDLSYNTIWKAVAVAKQIGYKIDGSSAYAYTEPSEFGLIVYEKVLVTMSKD
jgi:hypothetical protein